MGRSGEKMSESRHTTSKQKAVSRRDFLDRILAGWGFLVLLPMTYASVRYLLPVPRPRTGVEKVIVGRVEDLSLNSAKIIRLNERPVMLIKTNSGQIKALSARCTHLGCTVKFKEEGSYLLCNCHGSRFDLNGKNVRGPASTPLRPYKVSLEEDKIALTVV